MPEHFIYHVDAYFRLAYVSPVQRIEAVSSNSARLHFLHRFKLNILNAEAVLLQISFKFADQYFQRIKLLIFAIVGKVELNVLDLWFLLTNCIVNLPTVALCQSALSCTL
jgi:hypothetical protein